MTKREATTRGKQLIKKLAGRVWTLRVWENLGWHYSAEKPPLSVNPGYDGKKPFFCLMTDDLRFRGCGSTAWPRARSFNDPNKAVEGTIAEAEKVINNMVELLKMAKCGTMYK